MTVIKRILCAVDFSETSAHALDYALQLAANLGADLRVVYVFSFGEIGIADDVLQLDPDTVIDLQERLRHRLEETLDKHANPGVEVESVIIQGEPAHQIAAAAGDLHADLIVIGTHGHSRLERLLLGSVAEKIVRSAPVPVLSVPLRA